MTEPTLYRKRCEEPSFSHPHACSEMVPVEAEGIGAVLRECLPLISDRQVDEVIEALHAGIGGDDGE